VRLLLPTGTFNASTTATFAPVTINSISRATWMITDLCLWRPVGQGLGMRDIGGILTEYSANYATAIVNRGRAVTQQSYTTSWEIQAGVYEFPELSGIGYWGVRSIVRVDEIIS
jgi:hypothetical protein